MGAVKIDVAGCSRRTQTVGPPSPCAEPVTKNMRLDVSHAVRDRFQKKCRVCSSDQLDLRIGRTPHRLVDLLDQVAKVCLGNPFRVRRLRHRHAYRR